MQKETNRALTLVSLLVAMFITAIEGTIVATAMPSIVSAMSVGWPLASTVTSRLIVGLGPRRTAGCY